MFSKKEVNALIAKDGQEKDEKEREILLEETKKLLKSLTYEQLRSVYIFTLQKIK